MKDNFENGNSNTNTKLTDLSDIQPHEIKNNNKNSDIKGSINQNEKEKIKFNPNKNNFLCIKKGNTYIIAIDKNNEPVITLGPKNEWIFFIIFILFISAGFLFLFLYYNKFIPQYLFITGIIIYIIFISVYIHMFISNPGFTKKINVENKKDKFLFCAICKIYVDKKSKTVHCSKCGLCVEEFNHHCGWIGKCIGKNNLWEFYFLIFWIIVIIFYYTAAFTIGHINWFNYEIDLRKNERNINNK